MKTILNAALVALLLSAWLLLDDFDSFLITPENPVTIIARTY